MVDTLGLILAAQVHPADVADRDGGLPLLKEARRLFPLVERIFADGGYQGVATAASVAAIGGWRLQIVKRSDQAKGFVVLSKRWIVERTFAWMGRCRRLAKDFENLTRMSARLPALGQHPHDVAPSCKRLKQHMNFPDRL